MDTVLTTYYDINSKGRDFVIGDLHGCYDHLMLLLEYVQFDQQNDRVFSVGDLIDRGPKSLECLQLLDQPWFAATKGNHELMMEESSISDLHKRHWFSNGGKWAEHFTDQQIDQIVQQYIKPMPLVIVIGKQTQHRVNIVHAELTGRDSDGQFIVYTDQQIDAGLDISSTLQLTWARTLVCSDRSIDAPMTSPVICGHTPVGSVSRSSQHIFVDTALVYGRKLTAVELPLAVNKYHQIDITTTERTTTQL